MKTRDGFVSNSSSTSFMVIGKQPIAPPRIEGDTLEIPQSLQGHYKFDWEVTEYRDVGSRLNWAYMLALYSNDADYRLEQLERVLKKHLGVEHIKFNLHTNWNLDNDDEKYPQGYIDHQSYEQDEHYRIFDNDETLAQWIFADDSVVFTGNDNTDEV